MMRSLLFAFLALLACSSSAAAHPHVFVTSRSEVVYASKGVVSGVRQIWTFDDMFSSYAVQGLDKDGDGKYSRAELQPLAQTNVDSLKEYDYFTFVKLGGTKLLLKPAQDYWLDYADNVLTLHFFLPLSSPQTQGSKPFAVEIYDPSYFVDFELAEKDPATVSGAAGCAVDIARPKPLDPAQQAIAAQLDRSDPGTLVGNPKFGENLANHIVVNCP
jgi:ABC-type uncharacterized transport system substrate-binding protein